MPLNVRDFGALGDGATNDTAAIQAALDAVPTAGGIVYFPQGSYNVVNGGLTCANPVRLEGVYGIDGAGSRLVMTAQGGTLLTLEAAGSVVDSLVLSHPTTGTRNTDLTGVEFSLANSVAIENTLVEGFTTNVRMADGVYHRTVNCLIRGAKTVGLDIANDVNGDAGDMQVEGTVFDKGSDTTAGGTAVKWHSGGGLRFVNNKVLGGGTASFAKCLHLAVDPDNNTGVLVVVGNSFENWTEEAITIENDGPGGLFGSSIVIANNEIASYHTTSVTSLGIYAVIACQSVAITGNTFHDMDKGIFVDYLTNVTISGNAFNGLTTEGIRVGTNCTNVVVDPWQAIGLLEGSAKIVFDSSADNIEAVVPGDLKAGGAIRTAEGIDQIDGQVGSPVVGKGLARWGAGSGIPHFLLLNSGNPVDDRVLRGVNAAGGTAFELHAAFGGLRLGAHTTANRPWVGHQVAVIDTTLGIPIWSDGTNYRDFAGNIV